MWSFGTCTKETGCRVLGDVEPAVVEVARPTAGFIGIDAGVEVAAVALHQTN